MQTHAIKALQDKQGLMISVAHVHPNCDIIPIKTFSLLLKRHGWALATHDANFHDFGNTIADCASFILGTQNSHIITSQSNGIPLRQDLVAILLISYTPRSN